MGSQARFHADSKSDLRVHRMITEEQETTSMEKRWRARPPPLPGQQESSISIHEPACSPEEAQWGNRFSASLGLKMSSLTTG